VRADDSSAGERPSAAGPVAAGRRSCGQPDPGRAPGRAGRIAWWRGRRLPGRRAAGRRHPAIDVMVPPPSGSRRRHRESHSGHFVGESAGWRLRVRRTTDGHLACPSEEKPCDAAGFARGSAGALAGPPGCPCRVRGIRVAPHLAPLSAAMTEKAALPAPMQRPAAERLPRCQALRAVLSRRRYRPLRCRNTELAAWPADRKLDPRRYCRRVTLVRKMPLKWS